MQSAAIEHNLMRARTHSVSEHSVIDSSDSLKQMHTYC